MNRQQFFTRVDWKKRRLEDLLAVRHSRHRIVLQSLGLSMERNVACVCHVRERGNCPLAVNNKDMTEYLVSIILSSQHHHNTFGSRFCNWILSLENFVYPRIVKPFLVQTEFRPHRMGTSDCETRFAGSGALETFIVVLCWALHHFSFSDFYLQRVLWIQIQ